MRSSTFKNDVTALADQLDRMFPREDDMVDGLATEQNETIPAGSFV